MSVNGRRVRGLAPEARKKVEPARLPFALGFFTDTRGRVLSAFGSDRAPVDVAQMAPQAAAAGVRLGSQGFLPPRGFLERPIVGGTLLSVAGDRAFFHALYLAAPAAEQQAYGLRVALDFEGAYGAHLGLPHLRPETFSATSARVADAFARPLGPKDSKPFAPQAFVHAAVVPRGPGLLVALRIRNFSRAPLWGVSVGFSSPRDFMRPVALFGPGATVESSQVRLAGALDPGEKLLEMRFEPQEPREGPLTFVLRRQDGAEVPDRPLPIAVTAPKLGPPQGDLRWLAQEVMRREGDARDIWRLRFTKAFTPAFAFERVKEAVVREHPALLMEFAAPAPAYHEAWYLARIHPSGAPLLLEVAVRGPGRLIEFRAATSALHDLLGVKAEYRRRVRELLSEKFMGRRVVVERSEALPPSADDVPPHLHSALLMRHMQGELSAEDVWHELRQTATGGSGEGWQLVAGLADELGPLEETEGGAPAGRARAHSLVGRSAENEGVAGLFESFTRLMAPIVLAQTSRMGRPGARLRTGLDRGAEAEADAVDAIN